MKKILIAGGTGHLGRNIEKVLVEKGYDVLILTRNPSQENHVFWSPSENKFDTESLGEVEVIINLTGENIGSKRWSKERIKALFLSRMDPAKLIHKQLKQLPNLKHYITASGVNCYGYDSMDKIYIESDEYGKDTLSQIVEKWEKTADIFTQSSKKVTKMRTAVVLDKNEGAFQKIAQPIKMGIGSPLGSGKQYISWVHIDDVVAAYVHVIEKSLEGTFNLVAGNGTNKDFGKELAGKLKKGFWLPNVPAFLLKIILGKMSVLVLKGVQVSNEKLVKSGFNFKYDRLEKVFDDFY